MIRISDARIDEIIAEDVPYVDLTCEVLGIADQPGTMEYFTREACVACGTEVVARMAAHLGCSVASSVPSGTRVEAGATLAVVEGSAAQLHQLWKVGLNVLDHLSAVATKTRAVVDAVHAVNPRCEVLTTRKSMPGVKDLLVYAAMVGGAYPHRLGLSETILVFDKHLVFAGGFEAFLQAVPEIKARCIEKKLFVEAEAAQVEALARAGVDGIQLDKVPVAELAALVERVRAIDPHITLIAAGGVKPDNAAAYAATGVDGLATTALFTAKPLDMSVRMAPAAPAAS